MEYKIIEAKDQAANLTAEVNKHIQNGWQPIGGIACAVSNRTDNWWYYQAMVREQP